MSRDTSSRVICSPIFATSSLSKDVEWMVNGGAALPNEFTMRTRFGSAAVALLVKRIVATTRKSCARRIRRIVEAKREVSSGPKTRQVTEGRRPCFGLSVYPGGVKCIEVID